MTYSAAVAPTQWAEIEVSEDRLLTPDEFSEAMQQIGRERYHNLHPFHKMLHGGELNLGQVQAWALNRYYYQASIPRKDLTLMARLKSPKPRLAQPRARP